jgi:hypothetical protein
MESINLLSENNLQNYYNFINISIRIYNYDTFFCEGKKPYLLTPWSRVLLEKITGFAASEEIPCIYGTRKFITELTSIRHLSLS